MTQDTKQRADNKRYFDAGGDALLAPTLRTLVAGQEPVAGLVVHAHNANGRIVSPAGNSHLHDTIVRHLVGKNYLRLQDQEYVLTQKGVGLLK